MKQLNVRVSEQLIDQLKDVASGVGISFQEFITDVLIREIEKPESARVADEIALLQAKIEKLKIKQKQLRGDS